MQIPLKLHDLPTPRISDGVIGANQQAIDELGRCCDRAKGHARQLVIWGAPGSGKTFWLKAFGLALGEDAVLIDCGLPGAADKLEGWVNGPQGQGLAAKEQPAHVVLVDDIQKADPVLAGLLFRARLLLEERDSVMVCTANQPPLRLDLREDLRTRLGQGLIFELHELSDADKGQLLADRAARMGWSLPPELLSYLMTRLPRDLGLMVRVIDSLDEFALSRHRTVTIPLLKELLDSLDAPGTF